MARYEIVPTSSRARIEAESSVHPIRVEAVGLTGFVEAEVAGSEVVLGPGGRIEIPVDRLRSGNPLVDRETRRRIDVRANPVVTGMLTAAERTDEAGLHRGKGTVEFNGVIQPVEGLLHVDLDPDGSLRLRGEQTFDVRRWDLDPPRLLLLRVSPEVVVRIDVVATARG